MDDLSPPTNIGQGKSEYLQFFKDDPDLGVSFQPIKTSDRMSADVVLWDFLQALRSFIPTTKEKTRKKCKEFVAFVADALKVLATKSQIIVALCDKDAVPVQKGAVRGKRAFDLTLPVAVVDDGTPAAKKKIISNAKKIENISRYKEEVRNLLEREKNNQVYENDLDFPGPLDMITAGNRRNRLLGYLLKMITTDPELVMRPDGERIIFDGHCLKWSDIPSHYNDIVKQGKKEIGEEDRNLYETPIELTGITDYETVPGVMSLTPKDEVDDEGNIIIKHPIMRLLPNHRNNDGEFDCAFAAYIIRYIVQEDRKSFIIQSTDGDIPLIVFWLYFRMRNLPHTFKLSQEDQQKLEDSLSDLEIYIENKTNCINVLQLYNNIVLHKFGGFENEHLILSLVAVIAHYSSDYTYGFAGIGVKSFLDAIFINYGHIGSMIYFITEGEFACLHWEPYKRFIKSVFVCKYAHLFSAGMSSRKRKRNEDEDEEAERLKDLSRIKKLRKIIESLEYKSVRATVNKSITKKYSNYVHDPKKLAYMSDETFEKFLRCMANQFPSEDEVKRRCKLLRGYILFFHQYGNSFVAFPEAEQWGFKKIRNGDDLTYSNVKMHASNDWNNYRYYRFMLIEASRGNETFQDLAKDL